MRREGWEVLIQERQLKQESTPGILRYDEYRTSSTHDVDFYGASLLPEVVIPEYFLIPKRIFARVLCWMINFLGDVAPLGFFRFINSLYNNRLFHFPEY